MRQVAAFQVFRFQCVHSWSRFMRVCVDSLRFYSFFRQAPCAQDARTNSRYLGMRVLVSVCLMSLEALYMLNLHIICLYVVEEQTYEAFRCSEV